eukprot:530780_1
MANIDAVELLVSASADLFCTNRDGYTPRECAKFSKFPDMLNRAEENYEWSDYEEYTDGSDEDCDPEERVELCDRTEAILLDAEHSEITKVLSFGFKGKIALDLIPGITKYLW